MGKCCIYAHENGCNKYLSFKSGPLRRNGWGNTLLHMRFILYTSVKQHLKVSLRGQLLNNRYVLHYASIYSPFPSFIPPFPFEAMGE